MSERIFFIAGEPSGDALGASLIRGLKTQGVSAENLTGIGGDLMKIEGLKSLLPMDELCVMGVTEVLWQLPRLLRLIHGVVEEIEKQAPDIVVAIDLPDFNFQVAERLKKRGNFKGRIFHYVAPTVWAWRPGRAKKVAEYLDGVMCLFPFEPKYFEPFGLRAVYVGHPLVEVDKTQVDAKTFRKNRGIADDALSMGLFFGSRVAEIRRHHKVFLETADVLKEQYENLEFILPTLRHIEYEIHDVLKKSDLKIHVSTDPQDKWSAFAACDVAMAVSGTVGLELAYMGIPHIIGYKTNALTALILKMTVKAEYAHLANILLDEPVVPEFLQGACNTYKTVRGMMGLLRYEEQREEQKSKLHKVEELLSLGEGETPSQTAAEFIVK